MTVIPDDDFRHRLLDAGLLADGGAEGVYLRSEAFETIVRSLDRLISDSGSDIGGTVLHLPPVIHRSIVERSQYLRAFPDLVGSINVFEGDDTCHAELLTRLDDRKPSGDLFMPSDLVLCSAGCHFVYPHCTGTLPADGRQFEIFAQCFREESSPDLARMRSFRMHEFVYVGSADGAAAHRDTWLARSAQLLSGLGLAIEAVLATDAFFGRAGRLLSSSQRTKALKHELLAVVRPGHGPAAVASSNYHLDHFGRCFGISTPDGAVAHSACVGFGLERITLALLSQHGLESAAWPPKVVAKLWPS